MKIIHRFEPGELDTLYQFLVRSGLFVDIQLAELRDKSLEVLIKEKLALAAATKGWEISLPATDDADTSNRNAFRVLKRSQRASADNRWLWRASERSEHKFDLAILQRKTKSGAMTHEVPPFPGMESPVPQFTFMICKWPYQL